MKQHVAVQLFNKWFKTDLLIDSDQNERRGPSGKPFFSQPPRGLERNIRKRPRAMVMQYIILIWLTRNGKKRTAVRSISWLEKGKKRSQKTRLMVLY